MKNLLLSNCGPAQDTEARRPALSELLEKRFPLHEHTENARLISGRDYLERHPGATVKYRDLPNTSIDGFPIYIARDESGGLEATFSGNTHAMIVGSTGSGKTTGFVIPFLNWMSSKKNKPSIVVSDPKNELNRLTANRFRDKGYNVLWLNFQDYTASDCWNPLTRAYRLYQKYLNTENEVSVVTTGGKPYNRFRGEIFKRQKDLDDAISAARETCIAEIDSMLGSISKAISPTKKADDPYWEEIASLFIKGILWAMLEDSRDDGTGSPKITESNFNFDTMIKIYDSFTNEGKSLNDHGYFTSRDYNNSIAYQLVKTSILELSAQTTLSCIISSFAEKVKMLRDTSVKRITCTNTVNFYNLDDIDRPTVIFISYRDEDSLHYSTIGMFISDLYTSLIETARKKGGELERPIYFMLDEFGNFPQFKDFEKVISACRSRNIWFMLIVQSYAQLNRVYGNDTADIIIDNLNMHIFFGSCNLETKSNFSKECGMHEVTSPLSAINGASDDIEYFSSDLVPLIPVSKLSEIDDGECIITQLRGGVIWSRIERSYTCPEYDNGISELMRRKAPVKFFDPKYTYEPSKPKSKYGRFGYGIFD